MIHKILPPHFSYIKDFLPHADAVFTILSQELNRQEYPITMFGKTIMQPRLVSFYGNEWVTYSYSKTTLTWNWWHPLLEDIKQAIIEKYPDAISLNSVLCNLYRDWQDSMWRHADNEKELWNDPHIYSVTLGADRKFCIASKIDSQKWDLILEHNSLLLMWSRSQVDYVHAIPKTTKNMWPRINLTFRTII